MLVGSRCEKGAQYRFERLHGRVNVVEVVSEEIEVRGDFFNNYK